jgi:hypothetical protein
MEGIVVPGSGALLLTALGLGLAYAATPGVVNTECLRRGITGGFRPAPALDRLARVARRLDCAHSSSVNPGSPDGWR